VKIGTKTGDYDDNGKFQACVKIAYRKQGEGAINSLDIKRGQVLRFSEGN